MQRQRGGIPALAHLITWLRLVKKEVTQLSTHGGKSSWESLDSKPNTEWSTSNASEKSISNVLLWAYFITSSDSESGIVFNVCVCRCMCRQHTMQRKWRDTGDLKQRLI